MIGIDHFLSISLHQFLSEWNKLDPNLPINVFTRSILNLISPWLQLCVSMLTLLMRRITERSISRWCHWLTLAVNNWMLLHCDCPQLPSRPVKYREQVSLHITVCVCVTNRTGLILGFYTQVCGPTYFKILPQYWSQTKKMTNRGDDTWPPTLPLYV